ncbi:hypothetical protein OC846_002749 [Tilletia horrida]|uniref:Palmitoyltransferase n=1 Tax=Tilletia horrida TaxID=155126 RepID=A0AAN6JUL2_9BASI|nr:hypothetical protein OC846_002749 [Tilletia horrida]KAK0567276.1 hypothetical protein OC861_002780 [Tilletia horrida]
MKATTNALAELDLERASTREAPRPPAGPTASSPTSKQAQAHKKPRPDPPECVKSLQRCAAQMEAWEKKQAAIARQREYQSSPPNQPEPLFQRFFTVPLVAVILSWVCIVYLWKIVYPALSSSPKALATKAEGIVLCAFFGILWSMTVWCWVTAVVKQPGNAKDYVPQQATVPMDPQAPGGQASQEPIFYNGPVAAQPAVPSQTADEGVKDPPGVFSAAIPVSTTSHTDDYPARPYSEETAVLETSVARWGAGTDMTAVSPSRSHFHKPERDAGEGGEPSQTDKVEGKGENAVDFSSELKDELFPRQRGRSSSIASSVTGLPPSPKFEPQEMMADAGEDVNSPKPQLGIGGIGRDPHEQPRPSEDSTESDVMPGGLPAHAKEYDWEAAEKEQQLNMAGQSNGPANGTTSEAPSSTLPASNLDQAPPPQQLHHLPVPQRYPNFWTTDEVSSGYCRWCNIIKPPRTHHCRKCGTCVLKMDHHCPWVGGCVGAHNYRFFLLFVLWVSALEVFVLISNAVLFSRGIARRRHQQPLSDGSTGWAIDGYMISLFPICAIFGLFTLTLTGAHTYLVCRNLSTIEEMGRSSRHHREDAILDAWARQPVEKRKAALDEFERWGGYDYLVRNRRAKKRKPLSLPHLPEPATAASSDPERQRAIAALKKKAENMLLMRADYASCGLQLAPKSFLRSQFLENGPWTSERTDANPFWLGGSAEHGPAWERLHRLVEERLELEGEEILLTGPSSAGKEGGGVDGGRESKKRQLDREIARLKRHTRGGIGGVLENVKQVFGTRPWEWFLPVGKPAQDGLNFPVNPRFGPDGVRRPRDQWPLPLR